MGNFTFVRNADGTTDVVQNPSTASDGAARLNPQAELKRQEEAKKARSTAQQIQKRVLKIRDYLDYLDYLRNANPFRFAAVMNDLQKTDPKTWLALQKYPQFRPLSKMVGWQAGTRNATLAIDIANGNQLGGLEKWLESTIRDAMKRDNWGPFAKATGSTLAAPPTPTYSRSRLGQYLSEEMPRLAAASKKAEANLAAVRAASRGELSSSLSRVGGEALNVEFAALDPDTHAGFSKFYLKEKLDRAWEAGNLTDEQYSDARNLLSEGKLAELQRYLQGIKGVQ